MQVWCPLTRFDDRVTFLAVELVVVGDRRNTMLRAYSGVWHGSQADWSINRQESYAIIEACQRTPHLHDTLRPIFAYSDNSSTVGLFSEGAEKTSQARQGLRRLREESLEYNLQVDKVAGEVNYFPGFVSRPRSVWNKT